MKTLIHRWIVSALCLSSLVLSLRAAEPTVLFSTGFEAAEGYSTAADLAGQNGWSSFGSSSDSWNGVLDNIFAGYGQQAYIGYAAPVDDTPGDGVNMVSVWKSGLPSVPVNQPLVQFSTLMAILDSTPENGHYDDFRWTVYNASVERLFTLDFDNHALQVNYALDDGGGFVSTGKTFEPNRIYELVVIMDVARNRWSARIDDLVLVTEQPITTRGASLILGDVDAVWAIRDINNPGDNYMVFDNYTIAAYANAIPPTLQSLSRPPDGSQPLRLLGEPNRTYVLEVTSDLQTWTPIHTNTPASGVFEYLDLAAINQPFRFYRVKTQ
ncbi:MAG: hypothetical protein ACO1QS_04530 [Verrucomicrobiota bacterium]